VDTLVPASAIRFSPKSPGVVCSPKKVRVELEDQQDETVLPSDLRFVGRDCLSDPRCFLAEEVGLVWQCSIFLPSEVVVVPLFDCGNVFGQIWGVVVL
jgi:hypothetical protein